MLSRFVIAFLLRRNIILISWLQSPSAAILKPKEIKSVIASTFSHLVASDGTGCYDLSFWMLNFSATFLLLSFTLSRRLFRSSSPSAIGGGLVAKLCLDSCDHIDQTPLSMGFSRQEHRSGLLFRFPGDLPDSGIEPASPALAGGFFMNWWENFKVVVWIGIL